MPDQLYLSLWVRGFNPGNMIRHFEELLRVFPLSRLRPGISGLRVHAVEFTEPPLVEQLFGEGADVPSAIECFREFENADCAYLVDGWWELWQYGAGVWTLAPSRVSLLCLGPEFDNEERDHLRIELGPDEIFLPRTDAPGSARKAESNLRGLLRLVREIESSLPVERFSLWSESGENFVERLQSLVSED